MISHHDKLMKTLEELLVSHGERWIEELREDIPHCWQRHGDLVLVGEGCFTQPVWKNMGETYSKTGLRNAGHIIFYTRDTQFWYWAAAPCFP